MRLERTTACLEGTCSIQLSYGGNVRKLTNRRVPVQSGSRSFVARLGFAVEVLHCGDAFNCREGNSRLRTVGQGRFTFRTAGCG